MAPSVGRAKRQVSKRPFRSGLQRVIDGTRRVFDAREAAESLVWAVVRGSGVAARDKQILGGLTGYCGSVADHRRNRQPGVRIKRPVRARRRGIRWAVGRADL